MQLKLVTMSNFCFVVGGPIMTNHKTKQHAMSLSFLPATPGCNSIAINLPFPLPVGEKLSLYAHICSLNTADFTPAIFYKLFDCPKASYGLLMKMWLSILTQRSPEAFSQGGSETRVNSTVRLNWEPSTSYLTCYSTLHCAISGNLTF